MGCVDTIWTPYGHHEGKTNFIYNFALGFLALKLSHFELRYRMPVRAELFEWHERNAETYQTKTGCDTTVRQPLVPDFLKLQPGV